MKGKRLESEPSSTGMNSEKRARHGHLHISTGLANLSYRMVRLVYGNQFEYKMSLLVSYILP
jgi:hypothetical protein